MSPKVDTGGGTKWVCPDLRRSRQTLNGLDLRRPDLRQCQVPILDGPRSVLRSGQWQGRGVPSGSLRPTSLEGHASIPSSCLDLRCSPLVDNQAYRKLHRRPPQVGGTPRSAPGAWRTGRQFLSHPPAVVAVGPPPLPHPYFRDSLELLHVFCPLLSARCLRNALLSRAEYRPGVQPLPTFPTWRPPWAFDMLHWGQKKSAGGWKAEACRGGG